MSLSEIARAPKLNSLLGGEQCDHCLMVTFLGDLKSSAPSLSHQHNKHRISNKHQSNCSLALTLVLMTIFAFAANRTLATSSEFFIAALCRAVYPLCPTNTTDTQSVPSTKPTAASSHLVLDVCIGICCYQGLSNFERVLLCSNVKSSFRILYHSNNQQCVGNNAAAAIPSCTPSVPPTQQTHN